MRRGRVAMVASCTRAHTHKTNKNKKEKMQKKEFEKNQLHAAATYFNFGYLATFWTDTVAAERSVS